MTDAGFDDGQIVVASSGEGTVRLILNGVGVTNSTGAALVVSEADEAMIVLADGSTNTLADTDSYADDADEVDEFTAWHNTVTQWEIDEYLTAL